MGKTIIQLPDIIIEGYSPGIKQLPGEKLLKIQQIWKSENTALNQIIDKEEIITLSKTVNSQHGDHRILATVIMMRTRALIHDLISRQIGVESHIYHKATPPENQITAHHILQLNSNRRLVKHFRPRYREDMIRILEKFELNHQ